MVVQSLYILNKAGGLVYQRDFHPGLNKLSTNDYLVIAGTFHSVHAMTTRVSPTSTSSGITSMETGKHSIYCFQTLTGTKFLLIADIGQYQPDAILAKVYQIYSDYAMKNPFYQTDMPIRSEQFDRHLGAYLMSVA